MQSLFSTKLARPSQSEVAHSFAFVAEGGQVRWHGVDVHVGVLALMLEMYSIKRKTKNQRRRTGVSALYGCGDPLGRLGAGFSWGVARERVHASDNHPHQRVTSSSPTFPHRTRKDGAPHLYLLFRFVSGS